MAKSRYSKLIQGLKPLFVAAIAVAVLSNPFASEAEPKQGTQASVLLAHSSIAGLTTQVDVEGLPLSQLEILVETPTNKELIFQATTDESGKASLMIDSAHLNAAGDYEVSVRHAGKKESFSSAESFEIYAGTVSDSKSTVTVSKNTARGGETVELTVALKDELMNPLKGHVVKVMADKASVDVYSPDFATDENGEIRFYALTQSTGKDYIVQFDVVDSSSNVELRARPKIAVVGQGRSADQGGSVYLSAEAGPLHHFSIEIEDESDAEVDAGDQLDVVVTAMDEDNNIVTDYTGTIRFSSTDGSATLPNDYTFLAEDAGSHEFSLAVKFVTPGDQTLSVNDTDQYTIDGEFDLEVVTGDGSDDDYDEDFVDDDFERDGDFTLISPASGSYSEDSIEVQGDAQYGTSAIIYLDEEEAGRTDVDFDNSFSYSISNLEDGTYQIYVDIVELGDGDEGEEEILEVLETSDVETVTIDTEAPELVSIEADPEEEIEAESDVEITILSEKDLENVSLLFEDEVYELSETTTSGKYTGTLPMPSEEGEYGVDVILTDALGNDAQYRDQLILEVVASGTSSDEEEQQEEEENEETELGQVEGLITTGDKGMVLLSWEAPESSLDIEYYKVYYGPSKDALYAVSTTEDDATTWKIEDLVGEELYYFAVAAVDEEGNESELSEAVVGVPLAKAPAPQEERPQVEEKPSLTELPPKNPETGAGTGILLALSGLGAGVLARRRR